MAGYLSFLLCVSLTALFMEESSVRAYITMGDESEFPMGMGYDEAYNIMKIKPKKIVRKTIGSYRLPKAVVPVHYNVEIRPILAKPESNEKLYTSPGVVDIRVTIIEPTNAIILHSKGIDIKSDQVTVAALRENATKVRVTGHNFDEERSFYTIFLAEDMTEGEEYMVHIPFISNIPTKDELMAGLYRVNYMGSDGQMKIGAVTQFQKDDASRTFPCFDEPQMKAEFTFKIGRLAEGFLSFSNMPRIGDPVPIKGSTGWVWDNYEKSIKFSTYLMAFAVMQDFVQEETPANLSRFPIRTWVPAGEKTDKSVRFAAAASGKIITYFEKLFDMEYPMPKMENLAVPDMDLLAMEHPGLVTYRTNLLVWRKGFDTQYEIFNGASLVAHEFVHQWLGNLVTCKWWNDFWLNEAFARYYQFIGADESGIDFRAKDRYTIDVVQWAMEFDEGPESVPIRSDETDKVFYLPFHIEYEKGGSIVRMMQTILTQKTFIGGLRKYFKKFKYSNAEQSDLFNAFTEQAKIDGTINGYDLATVMKPWLTKAGFPILQVSRGESNRLYISQQRFILHPAANDKIEPGLWYVPVWYITKSDPKFDGDNTPPKFWMDPDTLTRYIPLNNTKDWIIINPEVRGYYRVVYDRVLTNLIVKQLEEDHTVFPIASRSQLFDDYFHSARGRYITIAHAMALTSYLQKEDDLIVWTTVFNNLRKLYHLLMDTPIIEKFKRYILTKIREPFKRMGTTIKEDASPSDIMLYSMFFDWICAMEDEMCTPIVDGYMKKWEEKPDTNPIPVDIQSVVYCSAVAHCTDNHVMEFLSKQYHSTTSARQKNLIARALTCDKNVKNLKNLVENAINPDFKEINTTSHGTLVLNAAVRNPNGLEVVWKAIKNNAGAITKILGKFAIPNVLSVISMFRSNTGSSTVNYEFLDYIYNYLKLNEDLPKKAVDTLNKASQKIVANSMWKDYFYHDIEEWLNEYAKNVI